MNFRSVQAAQKAETSFGSRMRPCLKNMKGRMKEKNVEEEGVINITYRNLLYIIITNGDTLYIDVAVLLWCYTLIHS